MAIYVAIFGLLLVGFMALSIDAAYTVNTMQELHVAADAAALAAAAQVKGDDPLANFPLTRAAAVNTAALNEAANDAVLLDPNPANLPGGDVVVGWWDPITKQFHPYDPLVGIRDAVRVRARRTTSSLGGRLALFFGGIFGTPDIDITRGSTANLAPPVDPHILVLDRVRQGTLHMNGNPVLSVLQGAVQVDSDAPDGLEGIGGPTIAAKKIKVCGPTYRVSNGTFNPTPKVNSPYIPDPLLWLPTPTIPNPPGPPILVAGVYPPGYYSYIDLRNSDIATLLPGNYIIAKGSGHKHKGIELSGSAQLVGTGVFIYLHDQARIDITGGAGMQLTPPVSGTYQGVTIFQGRNSFAVNQIHGLGVYDVQGTMYHPKGGLDFSGNVGHTIGRIVVWTMAMNGNGTYTITGAGFLPPPGPDYVFLVE